MAEGKRAYLVGAALMVVAMILAISVWVTGRAAHASSTFTVNSTADTGDSTPEGTCDTCTLREAIQEANNNNNPSQTDRINFHISGTGVHTISPTSPLPFITEPVTINGYTQRPCSSNPAPCSKPNTLPKGTNAKLLIEINGTNAIGHAAGLSIRASDTVVKGLVINRFLNDEDGYGIIIRPENFSDTEDVVTNVRIEGNFLGTDPSGTIDRGNGASGVVIVDSSYNTIGGTSEFSAPRAVQ